MLSASLSGLPEDLRQEVQDSRTYAAMKTSPALDVMMLATSQNEEQWYMSSCTVAARDQDVLAAMGGLAGRW
jgi:hypothetical protein